MVKIIRYLHNKDLAIIRDDLSEDPKDDLIFYLYEEINEDELKKEHIDNLLKKGIKIIQMGELLNELDKQNKKLIGNIPFENDDYLIYNLFGYFLFIKLALREIQNIVYRKGLTKIAYIIAKDEENIAYEFSQYLISELKYDKGLEKDVLDIVNDNNKFVEYYKKLKEKLKDFELDSKGIKWAYEELKNESSEEYFEKFKKQFRMDF